MKKVFIWLLKKLMTSIYIFFINLPKLGKTRKIIHKPHIIKKISRITFPVGTTNIITFSDNHFGHKYSNPKWIEPIVNQVNPDVIIITGDIFDSKNALKILRPDELVTINFLRKFGQTKGKRLIIIKGDHDWWLTNKNLFGVRVYEKIIAKAGNEQIIAAHGDEFDKHKKTNGNFLKRIIEPCFYFIEWLSKEHNSEIAKELLKWVAKTPEFVSLLKYSKKSAFAEMIKLDCKVIILGHWHLRHKFIKIKKINGKRKRLIYTMSTGNLDAPKEYIRIKIRNNGKIRLGIKTYHQTNRKNKRPAFATVLRHSGYATARGYGGQATKKAEVN